MAEKRILLVEDERELRDVLALGLRRAGYTVEVAGSVADADQLLKQNNTRWSSPIDICPTATASTSPTRRPTSAPKRSSSAVMRSGSPPAPQIGTAS